MYHHYNISFLARAVNSLTLGYICSTDMWSKAASRVCRWCSRCPVRWKRFPAGERHSWEFSCCNLQLSCFYGKSVWKYRIHSVFIDHKVFTERRIIRRDLLSRTNGCLKNSVMLFHIKKQRPLKPFPGRSRACYTGNVCMSDGLNPTCWRWKEIKRVN